MLKKCGRFIYDKLQIAVSKLVAPSILEWPSLFFGLFFVLYYAWVLDDAYVYFRYIDNCLFLNYGLCYNQGEYVEGFSSPLWCLLLLGLRITHLNYWILIRVLAVLCFLVFWYLLVVLNRAFSPKNAPVFNLPLIFLCYNYSVLTYFSSGLETPLVQIYALLFALSVVYTNTGLSILIALAPLVRHEFVLPLFVYMAWTGYRQRGIPWRLLGWIGALNGCGLVFRIWYYADLFPNPFYLKDVVDWKQGFLYVHDSLSPYRMYAVLPVFGILLLYLWKQRSFLSPHLVRIPERTAIGLMSLLVAGYVIKIGGDPRHFRYLAFSYCLLIAGFSGVAELLTVRHPRVSFFRVPVCVVLALYVACLYPHQLTRHPITRNTKTILNYTINEASWHRGHPLRFSPSPWEWGTDANLDKYETLRSKPYAKARVHGYCFAAYYCPDMRIVHAFGLTDPFLSRTDIPIDRPAHRNGLKRLAEDLRDLLLTHQFQYHPGLLREICLQNQAPVWIQENLDEMEIVEKKMLNTHRFWENARLAFTFSGVIHIEPVR